MSTIDAELGIVRADPPRGGTSTASRSSRVVARLQERPGEWYMVHQTHAATGQTGRWKALGCEAVSRRDAARGVTETFARWPEDKPVPESPLPVAAELHERRHDGPRMSPEDTAIAKAMHLDGHSLRTIAALFRVDPKTAAKYVRNAEDTTPDHVAAAAIMGKPTLAQQRAAVDAIRASIRAARPAPPDAPPETVRGTCPGCGERGRMLREGRCVLCRARTRERDTLGDGGRP